MENPWLKLSVSKPYVLDSDRQVIEQFQRVTKEENKLKVHLLPIPFIGNHFAPVLFLNLNPGHHPKDDDYQITKKFETVSRNCLAHVQNDYPFYFLDSSLESSTGGPGYKWWAKRTLGQLLKQFDMDSSFLAKKIFCVEYFPYRSVKFRPAGSVLASQKYGFNLVQEAMRRQAQIILMRSKKLWFQAVPDLEKYPNLATIKNPRNPAITEHNLPAGVFNRIVEAIKSF